MQREPFVHRSLTVAQLWHRTIRHTMLFTVAILAAITTDIAHAEEEIDFVESESISIVAKRFNLMDAKKEVHELKLALDDLLVRDKQPTLDRMLELAEQFKHSGKFKHAEDLYLEVLAYEENHPRPRNHVLHRLYQRLAFIYKLLGKYVTSESYYKKLLEMDEKKFGMNDRQVIGTLMNLAYLYKLQGKFSTAVKVYERVLRIRKSYWGTHSYTVEDSLNRLSELYEFSGNQERADYYRDEAQQISKSRKGADRPETTTAGPYVYKDGVWLVAR